VKAFMTSCLVAAAGATVWIVAHGRAPTYQPPGIEASAPVPSRLTRPPASDETRVSFEVANMCCAGCTGKLYARLSEVDGVREACVDFHSGTAGALVVAGADLDALERALNFDKYVARRQAH
jgi:copper chaperone CopZ